MPGEMDYASQDFSVGYQSASGQAKDAEAKAKAITFVNTKLATVDTLPIEDFHEFEDGNNTATPPNPLEQWRLPRAPVVHC